MGLLGLSTLLALASCATAQGPELTVNGVEGWRSAHALFFLVPADGGVVLVDAGMDSSGDDVRRALGTRKPVAVLLTHGHIDHWSGAAALEVPVYVGRAERPLLRRNRTSRALIPWLGEVLLSSPRLPRTVVPVDDGDVLVLGGRRFVAVAMPGHTPGSVAWLMDDLAFTGDALGDDGAGGVDAPPSLITDDVARARASLVRLWPRPFSTILDGHSGVMTHADKVLRGSSDGPRTEDW